MKASRAYIAGLGTSGVLIASFVLLFIVVSAIVAFRGFPGEATNDGLERLDVSEAHPAARVARAVRLSGGAVRVGSRRENRAGARRPRDAGRERRAGADGRGGVEGRRTAGGVAGGALRGGSGAGAGGGSGTAGGLRPPMVSGEPGVPSPTIPEVADGVAGAVQETAGGLGAAAPPLEAPIVQSGDVVAGVIEQAAPVVDGAVSGVTGAAGGVSDRVAGEVTGGGD